MATLESILAEKSLTPLFQPLVAVDRHGIFGYEALIRGPSDSPLHAPLNLFDAACRHGRLADVEMLCREVSIKQFGHYGLPGKLFLNVTPSVILQPDFEHNHTLECLAAAGLPPERLVIELTEHYPVDDFDLMREAVTYYKRLGFAIAIDDLGAGYSGLRQWSELRPDFVKIDRHFIQDIHEDAIKRQFVHSICEIARTLGCKVVAEGIETQAEYQVIRSLGVSYAQGYYFARPQASPPTLLETAMRPERIAGTRQCRYCTETVASLVRPRPAIPPHALTNDVVEIFQRSPQFANLVVVDDGRPVGIVKRSKLLDVYATHFGRALHGRKPIATLMYRDPLVVSSDTPVERLSQRITDERNLGVEDEFVITDGAQRYQGTGTLIDLLRKITALQIRNARYANPLTLLPGNVPINEHIESLLAQRARFAVVHCDLDHFKPFNDSYGYARGDDVIRSVAGLLEEHVDLDADFVGHVGGDDFLLVFTSRNWEQRCQQVLEQFEREAARFYDPEHRAAGGIHGIDRSGEQVFFPILSISMGAVLADPDHHGSHHDLAVLAATMKSQAKRSPGNSLSIDRRHPGLGGSPLMRRRALVGTTS